MIESRKYSYKKNMKEGQKGFSFLCKIEITALGSGGLAGNWSETIITESRVCEGKLNK